VDPPNLMRLSSQKAAHATLVWNRVQEIRASRSYFARCGIPRLYTGNFETLTTWNLQTGVVELRSGIDNPRRLLLQKVPGKQHLKTQTHEMGALHP
jgi:hypothetical protein